MTDKLNGRIREALDDHVFVSSEMGMFPDEWESLIGEVAAFEARLSKMEEALNLILASPKDRLEYCKANNLFPDRITATESVDIYWRKAIAKEALAGGEEA